MARSLLILMLMTTQLLAGSGASVYLCIGSDGWYCLDAGPDSCTCCHDDHGTTGDGCKHEHGNSGCNHHEDAQPIQLGPDGLTGTDPCGCTHIPVIVSSDETASAARATATVDVERLAALIALPLSFGFDGQLVAQPVFHWSGPPAVPDFALTVISTVVIRC